MNIISVSKKTNEKNENISDISVIYSEPNNPLIQTKRFEYNNETDKLNEINTLNGFGAWSDDADKISDQDFLDKIKGFITD